MYIASFNTCTTNKYMCLSGLTDGSHIGSLVSFHTNTPQTQTSVLSRLICNCKKNKSSNIYYYIHYRYLATLSSHSRLLMYFSFFHMITSNGFHLITCRNMLQKISWYSQLKSVTGFEYRSISNILAFDTWLLL